jgi:hypothetical protein
MTRSARPSVALPNELLNLILGFIGDDKPTLAKCMRVPLQLYQVVAPRLYSHLRWGGKFPFPLTTPLPSKLLFNRVSPTKTDLFGLTRTLRLDDHGKYCCSFDCFTGRIRYRLDNILVIPSLSYKAMYRGTSGPFRKGESNHLDGPTSHCPILAKIGPTKLLLRASCFEPLPIRNIDRRNLEEVVSWVSLEQRPYYYGELLKQHRQPFSSKSPVRRKVVYFITGMDGDRVEPNFLGKGPMVSFREHLVDLLYKRQFAHTVLIVNGAGRSMESAGREASSASMGSLGSRKTSDRMRSWSVIK